MKKDAALDGLIMHVSISGTSESSINTMFNLFILNRYTLRGKITWNKQTKRILLLHLYSVTVTMLIFRHGPVVYACLKDSMT